VPARNVWTVCRVLLSFSVLLLGADRALAYVGPGAGISFINHAMTLLAWVLAAFSVVLLWPAYALLRGIHRRKKRLTTPPSLEAARENGRAVRRPSGERCGSAGL
jgi:hypothetical protein